ncbi:MAG: glycosyltransferase family 39 protein [Chthonomonadales bacterium]|nr:glycosyltransferase family 39 protein [Chthonomonadales bacterium]
MKRPSYGDAIALAALGFLCFLWRLGAPGLFDFNEGLYVEAAREMVLRSDYITGRVNGVPFYDKPPLALWLVALSFKALGQSEMAARLPVALSALIAVFGAYWFGLQGWNRRTGLLAAVFCASSPIFVGTARQMTMDIHQSATVTLAMICMFLGMRADEAKKSRAAAVWWMGFWAMCGAGFMAKSFPGLLPIPIAVVVLAVRSRLAPLPTLRAWWSARPVHGMLALAAVVAPWHLAAYHKDGSYFVYEYWTLHHVALFKGTQFDHVQPFWYYGPALLGGFYPWSILTPLGLRRYDASAADRTVQILMWTWALVTVGIFSLMTSKLVSYLLPMYPAIAIITAAGVDRALSKAQGAKKARAVPLLPLSISLIAVLQLVAIAALWQYVTPRLHEIRDPEALPLLAPNLVRYLWRAVGLLACGSTFAAFLAWRRPDRGVTALVLTFLGFLMLSWEQGLPAYDQAVNLPLRKAVRKADALSGSGSPLVVFIGRPRRPSVFFYLDDRRLIRSASAGRPNDPIMLETIDQEPLRRYVSEHGRTVILADRQRGKDALGSIAPYEEAYRSGRWSVLVTEPGASKP